MPVKTSRGTKIQKGVSLYPDTWGRIDADAERLGLKRNEVVEAVLEKAFPCDPDLHEQAEKSRTMRDTLVRLPKK